MAWNQVSEHRWERPASAWEEFFIMMDNISGGLAEGRRHFTSFSRIKVELEIFERESALRNAWKQLRHEQPNLAVTVEDCSLIYEVPDEPGLQAWLDNTFIVCGGIGSDALALESRPIQQPTLYYLPATSELVFRAPHRAIDGVGTMLFWHAYLSALINPNTDFMFGDEAIRLPPSLNKTLGNPDTPHPDLKARAVEVVDKFGAEIPGIAGVNQTMTVLPQRTLQRELVFSEQMTDAIVQACKKQGFSVSAAVHAAFVLTMVKYCDPAKTTEETNYATPGHFSFRHLLPAPYNSSQFGVALFFSNWPVIIEKPAKKTFKDIVESLDEFYKTTFNGNAENVKISELVCRAMLDNTRDPYYQAKPPCRDPLVSSLGLAEKYLSRSYASADQSRHVAVIEFKFGFDITLGYSALHFWTFRNQLQLNYSFNEAFEEESVVQAYLEHVQKILLDEVVG
ncbi:hypothetical protein N7494_008409 [Penicillium frequentans]|uniref:Condensation domain-containing protein n=1 Tax=Penicillium frequentans TaxID=3151616 RepID=A0AAD6GED2_9EURO|nr:hypothetical protein N7494_008409 [Penicillium glabrum]